LAKIFHAKQLTDILLIGIESPGLCGELVTLFGT